MFNETNAKDSELMHTVAGLQRRVQEIERRLDAPTMMICTIIDVTCISLLKCKKAFNSAKNYISSFQK